MKSILFVLLSLFAHSSFAASTTVSLNYEYNIDYEKLTANVLCVKVYDAHPEGDGDYLGTVLWYGGANYMATKALKDKGYEDSLNQEANEQCEGKGGTTPEIYVFAFRHDRVSAQDVKNQMQCQNKSFVKREVLFTKSTYSYKTWELITKEGFNNSLKEIWNSY